MNKIILGIGLFLLVTNLGFGQVLDDDEFGDNPILERVQASRVAYITERE